MSDYKADAKASRSGKMKSMGCYADGGTVADDKGEYFPGGVMSEMYRRRDAAEASDVQRNRGQGPTHTNAALDRIRKDRK